MHKRPWFRLGEFATGILLCFSFLDRFQIIQMKATKEQQAADAKHAHEASKRAEKQSAHDEEIGPFVDQSTSPAEYTTGKNMAQDGQGHASTTSKKAVNAVPSAPKIASLASIYGSAAKGQQLHSGLETASHPGGRDEVIGDIAHGDCVSLGWTFLVEWRTHLVNAKRRHLNVSSVRTVLCVYELRIPSLFIQVRGGRLLSELDGLSDTDSDEGESWGVKKPPVDWWVVFHPATWDTMYTHPLDIFAGKDG